MMLYFVRGYWYKYNYPINFQAKMHSLPIFSSQMRPGTSHLRHSRACWDYCPSTTLRFRIYFNKFAFPVQNMGVIIAEQCMVDAVVCIRERYAEFTSEFSRGVQNSCMMLSNIIYNNISN